MEQERKCENCKYFYLHYVHSDTIFTPILEGHCTNHDIPWNKRKYNMPSDNVCEKWESNEEKKKAREESIKTVLKSMRTTLSHIEQILKEDLNAD